MKQTLSDLRPGQRGVVCSVSGVGPIHRRLQDLGLIPGTAVTCLGQSPLGDPVAYRIRGAAIALRKKDAAGVEVER